MRDNIIKILEDNAKDGWNGDHECVGTIDFVAVADEIVKSLSNNMKVEYDVRSIDDNRYLYTDSSLELSEQEILVLARTNAIEHHNANNSQNSKVDLTSVKIVKE